MGHDIPSTVARSLVSGIETKSVRRGRHGVNGRADRHHVALSPDDTHGDDMAQAAVSAFEAPLILIIDDVDDNRALYRGYLEREGYRVAEAPNASAGLTLARELLPAIIIMDLSMPDLDGWEATRLVKSDPTTRGIGVIALSAFREPAERRKARAAGADYFLAKPCIACELTLHVSECIRLQGSPAPAPFEL